MITIFTPTYNRANLLNKVYQSLLQPTKVHFEWVVVDDGSTDNTAHLVSEFIAENKINIRYFHQNNKGKHFAINRGVAEAKGSLFMILDSDDFLPATALQTIYDKYDATKHKNKIGGVAGRKSYFNGEIVGGNASFQDVLASALTIRYKYNLQGDLAEVFLTSVLKEFPFPEIQGEKFCPEALVWNRIAQKYKLLYFNKSIYHCEYLPDGLTAKIVKIRMTSPIASMMTYSELASYNIPFREKIKASINFWRFSFTSHLPFLQKITMVGWPALLLLPVGALLYYKDKNNNKTTA